MCGSRTISTPRRRTTSSPSSTSRGTRRRGASRISRISGRTCTTAARTSCSGGTGTTTSAWGRRTRAGTPIPTFGIRQFQVGTGGVGLSGFGTILRTSEVRNSATHGVMKFTLHSSSYDFQFIPIAGQTFTDAGTFPTHGPPGGSPSAPRRRLRRRRRHRPLGLPSLRGRAGTRRTAHPFPQSGAATAISRCPATTTETAATTTSPSSAPNGQLVRERGDSPLPADLGVRPATSPSPATTTETATTTSPSSDIGAAGTCKATASPPRRSGASGRRHPRARRLRRRR